MRRVWLVAAWVTVVAGDLYVFASWMGADLDETCGGPLDDPCNEFMRDHGLLLLAGMLVLTAITAAVVFKFWRREPR
jgi:hypothetical protein